MLPVLRSSFLPAEPRSGPVSPVGLRSGKLQTKPQLVTA
jgi:hypothetical protein